MALICIPPEKLEQVKKIVTSSSSISRNKQLTDLFGSKETAKEVNTLYEKSLLLKNQDTAIDKFVSNFTELGQAAKQEMKDKIKLRLANRTEKIQNDELLAIAQDVWAKKYKVDIPLETVQKINQVKIESDALKKNSIGTPDGSPQKMAFGLKQVQLKEIISSLKNPRENMGFIDSAKSIVKDTASRFSKDKGVLGNIGEAGKLVWDTATSAIYKSIQASMDLSYALRQGFKVLTTNPAVWKDNFIAAFEPFKNLLNQGKMQEVADLWQARVVSSDLYQQAIDSKLAIGVIEDFFPTTLAEKIPVLGNLFKASNEAFTIFSQGSRMGLFEDMYSKYADRMTPELSKNIATFANSITGRGHLGILEKNSSTINKIFYSGRYIKSSIDTFTMPFNTKLAPEIRQEALKASVNNLGAIGVLMYTASLFTTVENNPLSSKFGKMKVPGSKDTWIDLTAGLGSYITAASKIALEKTKSTTTGKITPLNQRDSKGNLVYGGQTAFDVAVNWMANKLSPAPSTAVQYLKGQSYNGKKPTLGNSAANIVTPIAAGNAWQEITSSDSDSAKFIASVADILGMNQTNYSQFQKKK